MDVELGGVQRGWTVYGRDGKKVGEVDEVTPTYLKLRKGFIFKKDIYVPTAAVGQLRGNEIHLTVPQNEIEALGWETAPFATAGLAPGAWATIRRIPVEEELAPLVERVFSRDALRIPVRAERVAVTKTPVITGELAVRKEQRHEQQTVAATTRSLEVDVDERVRETMSETRAHNDRPNSPSGRAI